MSSINFRVNILDLSDNLLLFTRQSGGKLMTRKQLKALRRTKAIKKKQNISKAQSAATLVAAGAVLATSNISAQSNRRNCCNIKEERGNTSRCPFTSPNSN